MRTLSVYWANCFNLGKLPMRGTIVSALVFGGAWAVLQWNLWNGQMILIGLSISWLGVIIPASKQFSQKDPLEIVSDEAAAAALIALIIPLLWWWYIVAFILFRFFDITKALGIKYLEHYPGAAGIILDDLGAALYTIIIITITHLWL